MNVNKKRNALAFLFCDPGGIQTHDFRNRNPAFYSAELRGLCYLLRCKSKHFCWFEQMCCNEMCGLVVVAMAYQYLLLLFAFVFAISLMRAVVATSLTSIRRLRPYLNRS